MLRLAALRAKCSTRLISGARESGSVPHLELPARVADRGGHAVVSCLVQARAEITRKYAGAYAKASKKDKGRMPG